jgi:hypothetical protein
VRSVIALGVILVIGLAACGGGTPTPSASSDPASPSLPADASAAASEIASAAPSAAPASAAATAPVEPVVIQTDTLIEIIVTDLIVRSAPGVDPAGSTILAGRLTTVDRAYVVAGPVDASGYAWYQVGPLLRPDGSSAPFGWIAAASREGEAWVRRIEPSCPAAAELAGVLDLQPLERLACFGDRSLTLTGPQVACGAGGGPWTWEPSWLMGIGGCGLAIDASDALLVRVPPGGSGLDGSAPATVSGHFDDAAAAGCTVTTADPAFPAPGPDEAVLICRTEFVVEP